MTLADEMTRTHWLVRAAARDGVEPHQRLQAARAAAEEQRTMSDDMGDLKDLIERATPILRELRQACAGRAKFEAFDKDLAAALLVIEPDALVTELPEIGEWSVETPEFRLYTDIKPERAQ